MKILCNSGLIRSRRVGKWNYYSINADGCEYAGRLLKAIVNRDADNVLRVMLSVYRFLGCGRAFGRLIRIKRTMLVLAAARTIIKKR